MKRTILFWMFLLWISAIGVFHSSSWISSVYHESFSPRENQSLCACRKCMMEYEPWFTELMKASPDPILTPENNISADDFKWYQRIQGDRRGFGVYNKTVNKVFEIFPRRNDSPKHSPNRCRTCAVVGNSGNLKGSHYGPLIDFHDIVIRINDGPTIGYERDVGNKTTHRVMFPVSATNLDNNTHLVLFPFKIRDLEWLIKTFTPSKNANSGLKANKDLVMILSPAFMNYVHLNWLERKGQYPSTGFLTLIFSIYMCDEVSVFGFGADSKGMWNHYFGEVHFSPRTKTGNHPGSVEAAKINELFKRKKINLYRGW
ncbi:CMP-N-acetylneuraminate-beta-galactosamide-alpha-2,3-sialyltransferase 2-like isoform X1 [Trematomus bernacchii]|uniref:CMP-N-acetylneuraminate-beta-galactosamide- alpha-2,3-sialyltransferase 2-like isoform X1 n=1 Tax=Trematomus bernacchii TaxID=40690 RepID=UPI00146DCA24|nr:CMP-N-acetylneuraminate-beta-galactosamide-alpha-2,3-sialyltransferase 2-like isoform X1 [Trematomus bernacchii]XP_033986896.1 CMP-N-acetylneuraminate-beta-galactosamide-alpha-2,3-sialyltransferase 2-like isoform X1 [Trematomus bernacchii]